MTFCVIDTSFVALANGDLQGEKPGNLLNKRLMPIRAISQNSKLRYNKKLLTEYTRILKASRNDVIAEFLNVLDDANRSVYLDRSTLSRQNRVRAVKCGWPLHDQHVLAAAIDASKVTIHVTEHTLGACKKKLKKEFGYNLNYVV